MSDNAISAPPPAMQSAPKPMLWIGYVFLALALVLFFFGIPAIVIGIVNIGRGYALHGWAQIILASIIMAFFTWMMIAMSQ